MDTLSLRIPTRIHVLYAFLYYRCRYDNWHGI